MSSSTDFNVSAEQWATYSDAEQQAKITEYLEGLTGDELEEARDALLEYFNEAISSYQDIANDLNNTDNNFTADQEAEAKELYDDLTNTIEQLQEAEDYVDEAVELLESLHDDFSDGEDGTLDIDDISNINGQTWTVELGGASDSLIDNNSNLTDAEYLVETGVTSESGIVIKDVNGDGFKNEADIDEAITNRVSENIDAQSLFLNIDSSITWTVVSVNWPTEMTLKLTDEDGNYSYINITDLSNTFFYFPSFNESQRSMFESLPTQLTERMFTMDDNTALAYQLTDSDEEFTNLSVIEGYEEALSGLSSVASYTDDLTGLNSYAQEALNELFEYYASDDATKDIIDVWNTIYNETLAGLSDAKKAAVIQSLIATICVNTHDTELLSKLFAPISTIENYLTVDGTLTVADKTAILLLENLVVDATGMPGAGNYGGPTSVWSLLFATDNGDGTYTYGKWDDEEVLATSSDENSEAITAYQNILAAMGLAPSAESGTALENENAMITQGTTDSGAPAVTISDDDFTALNSDISHYAEVSDDETVNQNDLNSAISYSLEHLQEYYNDNAPVSAEDIANYIINDLVEHYGPTMQDNLACALVLILKEQTPDLFNELLNTPKFADTMKKFICNDGAATPGYGFAVDGTWGISGNGQIDLIGDLALNYLGYAATNVLGIDYYDSGIDSYSS